VPGLEGFDLSQLDVTVGAHGSLLGAVTAVSAGGAIALTPDPMQTAELRGSADLDVKHVHWAKGETAVTTPEVTWHGETSGTMPRRTLVSHLTIPSVHLDVGIHDIDVNGIRDESEGAFLGNLADPDLELHQRLSIRAVEQTVAPEYPLGDLTFALGAERSRDGVIHVSQLKLANGAGGTTLALSGNVDLGEGRRTLSLTSALTQDLARLSAIPDRFKGTGTLAIESNVVSPDFVHYRVRSLVKGEAVTVNLPKAGIAIENASGEVPVAIALHFGPGGVALERTERRAGFSMLRFADQHPLLARSGVLSIGKLTTPLATISPLVGNLEIDENVISLRQFEMGVRGGTITGLCGVDWEGPRSTLELHVRASGVQSSHGEPFDGNLAVAISAADRTIDGRAEILKIGKRHLLDLLDLEDPQHADAGMNRIRTALAFGYPDSLRLVFDHGFANAHLELGGIARLVSIGDLRGIPMGPIVDKMIARMRAGSDGGDPR
jgi:translocation and assembly module TamB